MISKLLYITCSQDPKGVSQALAQSFAQAQASGELNVRRIGRLWPLLLMRAARFCGVSPIEIWKDKVTSYCTSFAFFVQEMLMLPVKLPPMPSLRGVQRHR